MLWHAHTPGFAELSLNSGYQTLFSPPPPPPPLSGKRTLGGLASGLQFGGGGGGMVDYHSVWFIIATAVYWLGIARIMRCLWVAYLGL